MNLVIEQSSGYFYGYLDGIEVTHRLNSREAEQLKEDEDCHAGSESAVFFSKKSLIKAAKKFRSNSRDE
jgi:hypothetical protein